MLTRRFSRRARPSPGRLARLAPWRARSEVVRQRNPVLRVLGDLDQAVLRALRTRAHGGAVEVVMRGLGLSGEWAAVWTTIGATGVAVDRERRARWIVATAVGPLAIVVNYAAKLTVGRSRPLIEGHPPLARAPTKLSFPSAHATSSVAAATALGRVAPEARPALYGLAAGICLSRPYLGMHYPSDVLAGVVLGRLLGRAVPGLDPRGRDERLIDLVAPGSEPVAGPPLRDGAAAPLPRRGEAPAAP